MIRRPFPLLLAAAVVVLAACKEDVLSLGDGARSDLTVRAFVDADGDGLFDAAADVAIAGATITMIGEPTTLSGPTDGGGVANFQVPPGSYRLSIEGDIPAGATLVTAATPVVVAPFQRTTLTAEFRYTFEPGSVTGAVFRDEDASGDFDPATDTPAPGLAMTLFGGADDTGPVVASVSTDSEGGFDFSGLRPGTYTVTVGAPATIDFADGASRTVTVDADSPTDVPFIFTGSLVVPPIETVRGAIGETVSVSAVVTWVSFDNRVYFIQDESAGLSVFDANPPAGLAEGDSILIEGIVSEFRGEVQIGTVLNVTILGQTTVPLPRFVTGAQINAGEFQGELVKLNATVDSITVDGFGSQTVFLSDAAGTVFIVFGDNRTGVADTDWTVGAEVTVTGVLGADDRSDRFPIAFRVEVRRVEDLDTPVPTVTIADARGMDGQTVTVEGIVTWQNQWDDRVFFLEDETGGISAFFSDAPMLGEGYRIRVTGEIGAFRGEVQISPDEVTVIGQQELFDPAEATAATIDAGEDLGQLVRVTGNIDSLTVDGFGSQTVYLTDDDGGTVMIFADNRTGVEEEAWTIDLVHTVLGVLGTDDRNAIPNRVEVRKLRDVRVGPPAVPISEARGRDGEMLTVEAVVSWQNEWDARIYFFQDGTGGFSTFDGSSPTLERGDRIRMYGTVGAFRGEVQLSPIALQITGPGFPPRARVVTAAQINDGEAQGELARATGTVDSLTVDGFGSQTVFLTDGDGDTFLVFVDNRTGVTEEAWTIGATVEVTGVLGTDDRDDQFPLPHRVEPRDTDDVVEQEES